MNNSLLIVSIFPYLCLTFRLFLHLYLSSVLLPFPFCTLDLVEAKAKYISENCSSPLVSSLHALYTILEFISHDSNDTMTARFTLERTYLLKYKAFP